MKKKPVIAPFRGLRYDWKRKEAALVTAPPYDVISEEQQTRLYERDPHNVVRLILGRQFPSDKEGDNRYSRAAADLEKWIRDEVLKRDAQPSFYLYEQEFGLEGGGRFKRRGFLALRRLEEFGKGGIQPHEKTLAGPKADRLLLMKACHANLSPIFSLYSDPGRVVAGLLEPHFRTPPLADFTDEDGVRQCFWRVRDEGLFQKTDDVLGSKSLFIADGHHRYETALAYRDWMKTIHPDAPEDASFHYAMMFFSDMEEPGLVILPTHRVLHDWPGFDAGRFKDQLKKWFSFRSFKEESGLLNGLKESAGQCFGVSLRGDADFHLLTLARERRDAIPVLEGVPTASRDVDTLILHQVVFRGMIGLKEEDDKDPRFMTFVKDAHEALAARRNPSTDAVFLLKAPPMEVLRKVVEAGMILPPKTTFFYPKLLSGLVLNPLFPDERVSI